MTGPEPMIFPCQREPGVAFGRKSARIENTDGVAAGGGGIAGSPSPRGAVLTTAPRTALKGPPR
jgi:hypothetical protein